MDRLTRWLRRTERHPSGCLIWLGATRGREPHLYGHVERDGKTIGAHRAIWEATNGPVPDGQELDHATTCVSKLCVEPTHLTPRTHRDNLLRSTNFVAVNAAKTHCVHGHSLADAHITKRGQRACRTCHRDRSRQRRAASATGQR